MCNGTDKYDLFISHLLLNHADSHKQQLPVAKNLTQSIKLDAQVAINMIDYVHANLAHAHFRA